LAGGLREFCESHPMLEHLHIDSKGEAALKGDWKLLFLKVLVYEHFRPGKGIQFFVLFCFKTSFYCQSL